MKWGSLIGWTTPNKFLAVILTADEMKDQYERAMKLHMSNKINEKNVYQLNLNLIDCIHQESFFIYSDAESTLLDQYFDPLS